MSLRIICLEEHVVDVQLSEAVAPVMAKIAPFARGLGSRLEEDAAQFPADIPRLLGPAHAESLAAAPIEQRLRDMDAARIDMQVLSSTKAIQLLPAKQAVDLARRVNDRLAEKISQRPGRFAGFSILPWQDADAAVRELERTTIDLGFVGTMLSGYPREGALVDDEAYAPILARLGSLGVPIYIHPGLPQPAVQNVYYAGFNPEVTARLSMYGWGWHNEAGIQVIRLILSGALDRHPGLRIISGHWGEMVPFFLQRMDDAMPPTATGLKRSISQTYRDQVYVTPSGMLSLPHFEFVRQVVGADRILFSVDYPYLSLSGARAWLETLPVSDDERAAIAHRNAERLLRIRSFS